MTTREIAKKCITQKPAFFCGKMGGSPLWSQLSWFIMVHFRCLGRWLSTILVYNVIFNYLMFRCHCFKELPIPQTNAANAAPQPPASSTLCTHDSPRNTRRVLSCRFATTQTEDPPRKKTQKKMPVRDRSIQQMMVCFFDRFVDWLSCNPHTPSCDPVTISPVGRVATATAWAP